VLRGQKNPCVFVLEIILMLAKVELLFIADDEGNTIKKIIFNKKLTMVNQQFFSFLSRF
jgi:hypothetical protein